MSQFSAFPGTKEEILAVEQYVLRVSIPLFRYVDTNPVAWGTGTLLEVGNRCFLVTADHLIDEADASELSLPLSRDRGGITTLGNMKVIRPNREYYLDVSIIELENVDIISSLRKNWNFLQLSQIGLPTLGARHVVCGFPVELTTANETSINQVPVAIFTDMIVEWPAEGTNVNKNWDLFFGLDSEAETFSGSVAKVPSLRGASGAVVWELVEPESGLWSPQKLLRAIGVQQSEFRGKWFRATSWQAVVAMLNQFDGALSQAIANAMSETAGHGG
jgi:hypothetical protein